MKTQPTLKTTMISMVVVALLASAAPATTAEGETDWYEANLDYLVSLHGDHPVDTEQVEWIATNTRAFDVSLLFEGGAESGVNVPAGGGNDVHFGDIWTVSDYAVEVETFLPVPPPCTYTPIDNHFWLYVANVNQVQVGAGSHTAWTESGITHGHTQGMLYGITCIFEIIPNQWYVTYTNGAGEFQ